MDASAIEKLNTDLKNTTTHEFLKYFVDRYPGKIALASSMSVEDQALTHMLWTIDPDVSVFTLDTGRLPQETYDVMHKTMETYGTKLEILFPEHEAVETMVREHGPNLFYESVENRKMCCKIRKVEPLTRKLNQLEIWICGLRREQAVTRKSIDRVEHDEANDMIKLNPLADWSEQMVWDYIKEHNVPYNALHDKGYPSIGCAPCTRAVQQGEDIRAGRWWWENPETKECGLHLKNGKLVRKQS